MKRAPRLLIVDKSHSFSFWFSTILAKHYAVTFVSSEASLESELYGTRLPDLVLFIDETGQDNSIVSLASRYIAKSSLIRIVPSPDNTAVPTAPEGEIDVCSLDADQLHAKIDARLTQRAAVVESRVEVTVLPDQSSFVRSSARMQEIDAQARLIAQADIPVLILGESGTGKEVLAKYIHAMSRRKHQMFLKVNCAAMPTELLESELFGHEQGAFTGATKAKPGKFEVCTGGTIFLDEIGEMPAPLQAKLLHVLQDGTFSRLGARTQMKADVRVIAATNVNVKSAIADRTFREDLYYRLNGFSFTLPPLRERPEEIVAFAQHFMQKSAAKYGKTPRPISDGIMAALTRYRWPGNLRELENLITRFLLIGSEEDMLSELSEQVAIAGDEWPGSLGGVPNLKQLVKKVKGSAEADAIATALQETNWNRKAAARNMQISYKALLYKIKQYEIVPSRSR